LQTLYINFSDWTKGDIHLLLRSGSQGMNDAFLARSVLGLLCNPAESTRKASFIPFRASCGR